jgi:hypothetical protein
MKMDDCWSDNIRGLEGFNGIGLLHHTINDNIIVVSSLLFDYISNKSFDGIPNDILDQLIKLEMIIKNKDLENRKTDNIIQKKRMRAISGEYLRYCIVNNFEFNMEYIDNVIDELIAMNHIEPINLVLNYSEEYLPFIRKGIGKLKFIMRIDSRINDTCISDKTLNLILEYNIGLIIVMKGINPNVLNAIGKYISLGISVVVEVEINNLKELYSKLPFIKGFHVNIKYTGNVDQQDQLIEIWEQIDSLKKSDYVINTNWEIPLLRMQNERHVIFGLLNSIKLSDGQGVMEALHDEKYLSKIELMKECRECCGDCGIGKMCNGYFLNSFDKKNTLKNLCFLAKYSIAKNMNLSKGR